MSLNLDNVATLRIANGEFLYTLILGGNLIWQADQLNAPSISAPIGGNVSLSCTAPSAGTNIYYTLNGDSPTEESTLYTEEFKPLSVCTIKAKAYNHNGYYASEISSAIYLPTIDTPMLVVSEDTATVSNVIDSSFSAEIYEDDLVVGTIDLGDISPVSAPSISLNKNTLTVSNIDDDAYLVKLYANNVLVGEFSV